MTPTEAQAKITEILRELETSTRMDQHVSDYYEHRRRSCCPECHTRGYLILPSYGHCQICLRLRYERVSFA